MATKNSNQMTSRELELLQREARKRMKIAEEAVYEESVDGVIVDPFPYKIKTAQFYYGGPSQKYPIWALTTHFIDGVRQRDVYLVSVDYLKKYSPIGGTEELFLKNSLFPMFKKAANIKEMKLQ
ncbi:MAG: hypothetical protein O7E52_10150 [Candidatus Poribacteria bacterium]|nr:hypothetical protein [Candidatus Poribacteria bacterium]